MAFDPLSAISPAGPLLQQFYAWERRGRGWDLYPEPVRPEPAFIPFFGHYLVNTRVDDGLRPTFISRIVDGLLGRRKPPLILPEEIDEPTAVVDRIPRDVEIHVTLPAQARPSPQAFTQCLAGLRRVCRQPLTLELVATAGMVSFQFVTCERDALAVEEQLRAYMPQAVTHRTVDRLSQAWNAIDDGESLIVECGLSHEFMRPLRTLREMATDPLAGICGALSHLAQNEAGVFQVIFEPLRKPWRESILCAVTFNDGSPFFEDDREFLRQAETKVAGPMYAAVVRVAAASAKDGRAWQIARNVVSALGSYDLVGGNEFIPLENSGYDDEAHAKDLLNRQSRRTGMILSADELVALVHLPTADVQSPALVRMSRKSKAAPATLTVQTRADSHVELGTNPHNGRSLTVALSPEQRMRHMHLIGASGTGKSTLMLSLITQDMKNSQGLCVLDPHGDLIEQVLARVPDHRMQDVVLVDPSDEEYAVGFNLLQAHSDLEKTLLSSDLVAIFRRFSTSWGDQMGAVLANAVLAFLENPQGGTLLDLRRFLIEPAFRKEVISHVTDSHVAYYWAKEFPLLSGRPQAPLLTRLDTFLRPKPIRHMLAQKNSKLDLSKFMDEGKIVLIKLGQGLIGEENAHLLGALFVAKFHQLALGRQAQAEKDRHPFWLYADEFGSYVAPSMARLFSGVRKYKLGLILAHQDMRQLHDVPEVESAVLTNAGTRVCFRLGDADAKVLAEGFSTFEANDLRDLAVGEALCRVDRAEQDFNLVTTPMAEVNEGEAARQREALVALTRERYAMARKEIEAMLAEAMPVSPPSIPAAPSPSTPNAVPIPTPPIPPMPINPVPAAPPAIQTPKIFLTPSNPVKPEPLPAPAPLGKGGPEHKRLQEVIAQWVRGLGYRASIEQQTPDGGSIDVVIEQGAHRIACEISVTSTVEQEMGNLRKCLSAGFTQIFMICVVPRTRSGLEKSAKKILSEDAFKQIRFLSPEEVLTIPNLLLPVEPEGQTVGGYKVTTRMRMPENHDTDARRQAIAKNLAQFGAVKEFG